MNRTRFLRSSPTPIVVPRGAGNSRRARRLVVAGCSILVAGLAGCSVIEDEFTWLDRMPKAFAGPAPDAPAAADPRH
jgi:hypothetical protein